MPRILTIFSLVVTLTFDFLILKSNQFIFVPKCTGLVNLVKFPSRLCNILFTGWMDGRTGARTNEQSKNIMPSPLTTGRNARMYDQQRIFSAIADVNGTTPIRAHHCQYILDASRPDI